MRAVIERAPFLAAMSQLMGVVERKNTIPILANILIEFEPGQAILRATDLDMEAVERLPAAVDELGATTVPADKLFDIVRNADDGAQITVATVTGDPRVRIQSGRSRFSVPALAADAFPYFPTEGLSEPWSFPAKTLADMLNRVGFIRGDTKVVTAFCTILLCIEGDEFHAMAASLSGIALRREKAPEGASVEVMLLSKMTNHLIRWLSDAEGDAQISWSDRLFKVEFGGTSVVSKVFDGQRLKYTHIILEGQDNAARTDQDAMKIGVRRTMIMGDGKVGSVRLAFADGEIALTARGGESGEGVDEIAADYTGPGVSFLMNAGHLQGALQNLRGDGVELGFAEKYDPTNNNTGKVVIRAPSDPGLLINLMQSRA